MMFLKDITCPSCALLPRLRKPGKLLASSTFYGYICSRFKQHRFPRMETI
jgi:hypothetical protein